MLWQNKSVLFFAKSPRNVWNPQKLFEIPWNVVCITLTSSFHLQSCRNSVFTPWVNTKKQQLTWQSRQSGLSLGHSPILSLKRWCTYPLEQDPSRTWWCACVCVWGREERREGKWEGEHPSPSQTAIIVHMLIQTPILTHISTLVRSSMRKRITKTKQKRCFAVGGPKGPSKRKGKKHSVTLKCLLCWAKRDWCLLLLLNEKNCINPLLPPPTPSHEHTHFLGFSKHPLCILHT